MQASTTAVRLMAVMTSPPRAISSAAVNPAADLPAVAHRVELVSGADNPRAKTAMTPAG